MVELTFTGGFLTPLSPSEDGTEEAPTEEHPPTNYEGILSPLYLQFPKSLLNSLKEIIFV